MPLPEEKTLIRQAQAGDQEAKERLLESHRRMVRFVASRYQTAARSRGLEFQDLVSYGNLGLLKAIAAFDPERDVALTTYAQYWVRMAILQALRELGWPIRLPAYLADSTAQRKHPEMWAQAQDVKRLVRCEFPGGSDREDPEPEAWEIVHSRESNVRLRAAVDQLPDSLADLVRTYYGLGCEPQTSVRFLGQKLGISHGTISNLLIRARKILARSLTAGGLTP